MASHRLSAALLIVGVLLAPAGAAVSAFTPASAASVVTPEYQVELCPNCGDLSLRLVQVGYQSNRDTHWTVEQWHCSTCGYSTTVYGSPQPHVFSPEVSYSSNGPATHTVTTTYTCTVCGYSESSETVKDHSWVVIQYTYDPVNFDYHHAWAPLSVVTVVSQRSWISD